MSSSSARVLSLRRPTRPAGKRSAARRIAFHAQAGRALVAHDWPRNVRELEQALGAALALAGDDVVMLTQLPALMREGPAASSARTASKAAPEALSPEDAALRQRLAALLEEHHGNINAVARLMGKDRTQIRRWLGRLGLDADQWR